MLLKATKSVTDFEESILRFHQGFEPIDPIKVSDAIAAVMAKDVSADLEQE
jgi:hypothetical protein